MGVKRLNVLIYPNHHGSDKKFNGKNYYLPKDIVGNYNVIVKGKIFCDQPINSNIKRRNKRIDNMTR